MRGLWVTCSFYREVRSYAIDGTNARNVSTSFLPYGGITYLINSFDYPNLSRCFIFAYAYLLWAILLSPYKKTSILRSYGNCVLCDRCDHRVQYFCDFEIHCDRLRSYGIKKNDAEGMSTHPVLYNCYTFSAQTVQRKQFAVLLLPNIIPCFSVFSQKVNGEISRNFLF